MPSETEGWKHTKLPAALPFVCGGRVFSGELGIILLVLLGLAAEFHESNDHSGAPLLGRQRTPEEISATYILSCLANGERCAAESGT
jgi:hypothetical protein